MNKTDRLLAIVLELQRKRTQRAEDLAAIFETSVRTIYRDVQSLSEAGVPIVATPGIGYSLMEGYFLPPVSLSVEEALSLILGTEFVEHSFDARYGEGALTSRKKIEAILPLAMQQEAARIRQTIKLISPGARKGRERGREAQYIEVLRHAVLEERKVRFHYSKKMPEADGSRESVRVAAPYGLALVSGAWMLVAYCELRQELRHFRLSRMNDLTLLEDRFQRPPDFNLQHYTPVDDRKLLVRLRADKRIADKVKETNYYFIEALEEQPEALLVTLRVNRPEELLHWILGWGADVVVLEPESLRIRIREEAQKMFKSY